MTTITQAKLRTKLEDEMVEGEARVYLYTMAQPPLSFFPVCVAKSTSVLYHPSPSMETGRAPPDCSVGSATIPLFSWSPLIVDEGKSHFRLVPQSHKILGVKKTQEITDALCRRYCSVAKSCLTLCNFMDNSTPDFPVLHLHLHLLELVQAHVQWVDDAI